MMIFDWNHVMIHDACSDGIFPSSRAPLGLLHSHYNSLPPSHAGPNLNKTSRLERLDAIGQLEVQHGLDVVVLRSPLLDLGGAAPIGIDDQGAVLVHAANRPALVRLDACVAEKDDVTLGHGHLGVLREKRDGHDDGLWALELDDGLDGAHGDVLRFGHDGLLAHAGNEAEKGRRRVRLLLALLVIQVGVRALLEVKLRRADSHKLSGLEHELLDALLLGRVGVLREGALHGVGGARNEDLGVGEAHASRARWGVALKKRARMAGLRLEDDGRELAGSRR